MIQPELDILIKPGDTIVIKSLKDTIIFKPSDQKNSLINKYIEGFYSDKFMDTSSYSKLGSSWTHIYITDTLNFQRYFQPVFSLLIKTYFSSVSLALKKNYNKNLCGLNKIEANGLVRLLHFRILVNDFGADINYNYERELGNERLKKEINITP